MLNDTPITETIRGLYSTFDAIPMRGVISFGLMAHRILRDVEAEADGWERSDFPIISKDTWCKIHDKYNSNQPVHQVLVTKASSRMLYVLFSGKRWIKNSGDGKGTAKALLDKIAGLEIEAQKSFMHTIAVFVDHPSYHRPGNPYGDIYGAFGDNQALRVDKDIQGSQDHSGRIDEERNGESMLWPEVAGKGRYFELDPDTSRRVCNDRLLVRFSDFSF
ncbi:hypothetical protein Tco_0103094 [Tanacetum coccineum]